jgi:hypothetical protein
MFTFSPLQITLASNVSDVQKQIIDTQNQLSTGKRTLNPGENGVVTRLTALASGYDVSVKNIAAGQNVLTVGQTTLTSMASIVTQLTDLATQAAGGTLSGGDLTSLDTTFIKLYNQLSTLVNAASVNGNNALKDTTLNILYDQSQPALNIGVVTSALSGILSSPADNGSIVKQVINTATDPTTGKLLLTGSPATAPLSVSANATAWLSDLGLVQNAISTAASTVSALQTTLSAMSDGATGLSAGLKSSVDSISNIDSTAMQAKLQSLNNQQSIDYYLVSQMNTESAAILAIFR